MVANNLIYLYTTYIAFNLILPQEEENPTLLDEHPTISCKSFYLVLPYFYSAPSSFIQSIISQSTNPSPTYIDDDDDVSYH